MKVKFNSYKEAINFIWSNNLADDLNLLKYHGLSEKITVHNREGREYIKQIIRAEYQDARYGKVYVEINLRYNDILKFDELLNDSYKDNHGYMLLYENEIITPMLAQYKLDEATERSSDDDILEWTVYCKLTTDGKI